MTTTSRPSEERRVRHVRPGSRHDLDPVWVILPTTYAGQELPIAWRATSTGVAGDCSGTLVPTVEVRIIHAAELEYDDQGESEELDAG